MVGNKENRTGFRRERQFRLIIHDIEFQQADGGIKEILAARHALLVLEIKLLELALATHLFNGLDDGALQGGLIGSTDLP